MSVDLMRLCWRIEFPTPLMSALAVKLADYSNDEGENVYPSIGRLERETRMSRAQVCKILNQFEDCGLLEVVEQRGGNKWNRSTTIRRFNLARLHELTATEVKADGRVDLCPSTHVLDEVLVDGKKRWIVRPRRSSDASDYGEFCQSTGETSSEFCQSTGETSGVHRGDSASPPDGRCQSTGETQSTKESTNDSPHTQGASAGGWAKHWTSEAQGIVEGMRKNASLSHVVVGFVDRVRGTLNPAKDVDACAYVRQIANRLRDFSQAVLEATAETMIDTRSGYLPAIADVVKVAKGAAGVVQTELFKVAAEQIDVSTEQGAAYSTAQQALRSIVGEDKFAAWFVKLVPADVAEGRLSLIAPSKFHANYVSTHFAQAMDAAARAAGLRGIVVTHPTGIAA